MKFKKVLVVYFSRTGNCKKIAKEIAKRLDADIEEIKTSTSYSGFFGYQKALFHGFLNTTPKIAPVKKELYEYDLIIIGGPIWGGSLSAPVRSFLQNHKNSFRNIAFFSTQGSAFGQKNLMRQMKHVCSLRPITSMTITKNKIESSAYQDIVLEFTSKISKENTHHERSRKDKRRLSNHAIQST